MSDRLTIDEAEAELKAAMTLHEAIDVLSGEYVYFVYCAGMVKIGFSRSLARRIVKMRTDMPQKFYIIHLDEGGPETERMLHREFADLRAQGEWFRPDVRIFDHIRRRRIVRGVAVGQPLPDEPGWIP